jgi:hypothetical protein
MRVIARHIRDDQDVELDTDQVIELQGFFDLPAMSKAGIVSFTTDEEWTYRLIQEE